MADTAAAKSYWEERAGATGLIWQENPTGDIIVWWMRSIQFRRQCSLYTPFIQTQFSHCPRLLFDLPPWTQCQKWFNFTPWINSTWYSLSRSHLTVRRCIYNAIDNIEQYWRQGWISTSGSEQEWSAFFLTAVHLCNGFLNYGHKNKIPASKTGGLCLNYFTQIIVFLFWAGLCVELEGWRLIGGIEMITQRG